MFLLFFCKTLCDSTRNGMITKLCRWCAIHSDRYCEQFKASLAEEALSSVLLQSPVVIPTIHLAAAYFQCLRVRESQAPLHSYTVDCSGSLMGLQPVMLLLGQLEWFPWRMRGIQGGLCVSWYYVLPISQKECLAHQWTAQGYAQGHIVCRHLPTRAVNKQ